MALPELVSRLCSRRWPVAGCNGDSNTWVVDHVASWMDSLCSNKVLMRTDQEAIIVALMNAVRAARTEGSVTIFEHSPVADSMGSGAAEKTVR